MPFFGMPQVERTCSSARDRTSRADAFGKFPGRAVASLVAIIGDHVLRGNAVIRNRATSFAVEVENDRLGGGEAEHAVHNMRRSICRRRQQDARGS